MKKIAVLAPENCMASSVFGPMDFFSVVNRVWQFVEKETNVNPIFEPHLITTTDEPITSSSGIVLSPTAKLADLDSFDLLMLAAPIYSTEANLIDFVDQVRPQFSTMHSIVANGGHIAAYCSSTFVLAASGLLNDKNATTSWWLTKPFARQFPSINLVMDELVVNAGSMWTAGASTSYLSLCLKLLEHYEGVRMANHVARVMLVDSNRLSQLPFMSMQSSVSHSDKVIARCQQWLMDNLEKNITIEQMADYCAMSKRNFIRRFKKAESSTPASYLQQIRVELAKRYLENSQLRFEEIVEKVGYEDLSAFRKVFVKHTEVTPAVYRQKFSNI